MSKKDIDSWFRKNTKLCKTEDLARLYKYVNAERQSNVTHKKEINFSNDYKFEYISSFYDNIREENIIKLNFQNICNQIINYFGKDIIDCNFETPCYNDARMKSKGHFKHDIYIEVKNNRKQLDCVIEYFETNSHTKKSVDNDKEIYTQQIVDYYIVFTEKDNKDENSQYQFYIDTIHKILMMVCTVLEDHYILSKINFFKNNQNNSKKLKRSTETFNKIINIHKSNQFNFDDFYNELQPNNPETNEEFTKEEFIEFLQNYNINIEDDICSYNIFSSIVIKLDVNISDIIDNYKNIYLEVMSVMFDSQKQIIIFINKINDKNKNISQFLDNFLLNHIHHYSNNHTLKKVVQNLSKNNQ